MRNSSVGIHTINIFRRYTHKEIDEIRKAFKEYSKTTGSIRIYPTNEAKTCYRIDYLEKHTGIAYWQIRYSSSYKADYRDYIVEAKINPKILAGDVDYIRSSNEGDIPAMIVKFEEEAKKISKHLRNFSRYRLNRVDYCVNFDLQELGFPCTPDQMMELIKRSNIPAHYTEYKKYHPVSKRSKSLPGSFYLKSASVVVNSYGKYDQLLDMYPDNVSIETSQFVIRFEIQCKYQKIYNMTKIAKKDGVPEYAVTRHLLSDEVARMIVYRYFERIVMGGEYYTLKAATEKIKSRNFRGNKECRILSALNLINQQRSVHAAKESLRQKGDDLTEFNRALHELVDLNINPVTIPKSFGITRIPNLYAEYTYMERFGVSMLEELESAMKQYKV